MSSANDSKKTLLDQLEDTVEDLIETRNQYTKMIEERLSGTTTAKISKMRKMKYKGWKTTFRATEPTFSDISSHNTSLSDNAQHQNNDLKKQIEDLMKHVQKIKPEIWHNK